jgi:hypothetical protein
MTSKPQLGKNIFKDEIEKGRHAAEAIRRSLDQLIEDPGPQTRALLIAKAAINLSKLEAALNQLDEIGRNARNSTNGTLKTE